MTDPFRLDGEVAIVTGGSRGIGKAIARSLADAGANVLICGRDADQGKATRDELTGATGTVEFTRADVTAEADVGALVDRCIELFGRPSILVNNAGPTDLLHSRDVDGPLGQISPQNWHRVQDSALTSAYLTTRAALPAMTSARRGAIVNITSIAAALAMPGFAAYSAGKAGLEAMTRSIAAEYAHLGIRCNAIRVGTIAVDHERGRPRPKAAPPKIGKDHHSEDWRAATPPAAGDPEDVANAVRYLASPAGSYVTGVVLPVDGGLGCRSVMPWQTVRPEAG